MILLFLLFNRKLNIRHKKQQYTIGQNMSHILKFEIVKCKSPKKPCLPILREFPCASVLSCLPLLLEVLRVAALLLLLLDLGPTWRHRGREARHQVLKLCQAVQGC